jgi:transcriptional regulator with XRE-family HTH domain
MPDVPTAIPDKVLIRALIRARGYSVTDFARRIGRSPASIWAITGAQPRPTSLTLLRQIAGGLSTSRRPVKLSDISDWAGEDDDIESGAETKIPA